MLGIIMTEENNSENFISKEDLASILKAKEKVALNITLADKASAEARAMVAEARIADLEYRALVQHIFIKHKMSISDRIDDNTGEILHEKKDESEINEVMK